MIDDLDAHVARFRDGRRVARRPTFLARTAADANDVIVEICRNAGATVAAKSKSMATEEIGLNEALEAAGVPPGRDRPRRVHPPARRRAPGAHPRAGHREDDGGRGASSCPVSTARLPAELEELTRAARRQLRRDVPRRRRRHHGRELRRLPTPARSCSSRTRATGGSSVEPAARPRRAHRHGAARRLARRSGGDAAACSRAAPPASA